MAFSPLITQLISHLRCLPGIGPKSAQRMAFYLLERARSDGLALARSIETAIQKVGHCKRCRGLTETELCTLCANPKRNEDLLCVVETPIDVVAIEQSASYNGYYFVLMGRLSPLDGIGPQEIGIKQFLEYIHTYPLKEVILATNPTVEGEATAHYLAELLKKHHIKVSRIAHGVPLGSELEFIDGNTISRSLYSRTTITESNT